MSEQLPPVVDLIIRYDSRTNAIEMMTLPQEVSINTLFDMLDAARRELRQAELRSIRAQIARDTQPPEMPGGTATPSQVSLIS